jgi:hypothetical protein
MRIYVHGVDTFLGKVLVRELRKGDGGNHRIFGTFAHNASEAPKVVKRALPSISSMGGARDPQKEKKIVETVQSCRLVVMDLFSATMEDLCFIIQALKVDPKSDPPKTIGEGMEDDITFVLVSSLMVWSDTPPQGSRPVLLESDYKSRTPKTGSRYEQWRQMEELVMNCFNREGSKIKGLIVAPGVLYGEGEKTLGQLFKGAWLGETSHVVIAPGKNRVPTVHVRDLARMVRQLGFNNAEINPMENPYYLAVDQPEGPPDTPRQVSPPTNKKPSKEAASRTGSKESVKSQAAEGGGEEEVPAAEDAPAEDAAEDAEVAAVAADAGGGGGDGGEGEEGAPTDAAGNTAQWAKSRPVTQAQLVQGIVDDISERYDIPRVSEESLDALPDAADEESENARLLREALTLDLWVQPSAIMLDETFAAAMEPPGLWCRGGLLSNLRTVANEFCQERKLRPVRVLIAGPPASGKTTLAKSVAEHFNIPHLELDRGVDPNSMLDKLASKVCRYRGYVLDAGGMGLADCDVLFRIDGKLEPAEGEEEEAEPPPDPEEGEDGAEAAGPKLVRILNKELCPEFVVVTQAPEKLCQARWKNRGTLGADKFLKAWEEYRATNLTDDVMGLTDFFQDIAKIGVLNLPINLKDPEDMLESVRIFVEGSPAGRPYNYLRTEDEVAKELLENRAAHEAEVDAKAAEEARRLAADNTEQLKEAESQAKRMQIISKYETERAALDKLPLREYLMSYMVPSLTEGLIEVCKVLPEDPVDYLATYLEDHAATAAASQAASAAK